MLEKTDEYWGGPKKIVTIWNFVKPPSVPPLPHLFWGAFMSGTFWGMGGDDGTLGILRKSCNREIQNDNQ